MGVIENLVTKIFSSFIDLGFKTFGDKSGEEKLKKSQNEIEFLKKRVKELEDKQKSKGLQMFEVAMGLNNFNKSKLEVLKTAVEEYKDVYSAVVVGNAYNSGIARWNESKNKFEIFIKKDREEAIRWYKMVENSDTSGLVKWSIGWNREMEAEREHNADKKSALYKEAYNYYVEAADMGYAKAYNSLGKFLQHGLNKDVRTDLMGACVKYSEAAKNGDYCGAMNAGFLYMNRFSEFENAEEMFEKAVKLGDDTGKVYLAKLYLEYPEIFNKDLQTIVNLITEAISNNNITQKQIRTSYYRLYKILDKNPDVNFEFLKEELESQKDKSLYCKNKAEEILSRFYGPSDDRENSILEDQDSYKIWKELQE